MSAVIRTPDQRLRVFLSSTLGELAAERGVVRTPVERLRLTPVMFELGARPHPPRALYRSYVAQSDVFVGIYWQRYGWIAPGEAISGLEDEYRLSGGKPRLIYIKSPAPDREDGLKTLLAGIQSDDTASYKTFGTPEELQELLENDLALLLTERFESTAAMGDVDQAGLELRLSPPPIPLTSLLDRDAEVDLIRRLVGEGVRLITLTGAGGIGKSRLAVEVIRRSARELPEVHFVPLASVSEAADVMPRITESLGIRIEGTCSAVGSLVDHLGSRRLLLLLDNFEQVARAAPHLVELLDGCAGLQVLVTSRQVLRLRGEREVALSPLPVPAPGGLDAARGSPAVQLFVERASSVQPSFRLVPENTEAVAEVCRRLDGVPLAIELAAARVRLLSPASLLKRLSTRLELLTAGAADLPERQRTLRATIDWSYQLLNPDEQALFARLAVFAGGWTIDAAERVYGESGEDMLGTLTSLLEKSLLILAESQDGGEPRLRMLETVREFAEEKLVSGADYSQLRERHAEYFLQLVEQRQGDLRTSSHEVWSACLDAEIGNLRLAVQWWTDHHDYRALARFAWATLLHYWLSGRLRELTALLRVIPDSITSLSHQERGRLLIVQSFVAMEQGSLDRAAELATDALQQLEGADDLATLALALLLKGQILSISGDTENAAGFLERGHEKARVLGDAWMDAMANWTRGFLEISAGNLTAAHDHFRRSVELARQIGHWQIVGIVESSHGFLYFLEGDLAMARSLNHQAVDSFRRIHYREGLAHCLQGLAMVAAASGELAGATEALAATDAVRTLIGVPFAGPYRVAYEGLRDQLRQELGDQFAAAWATGQATDLYTALDRALRTGPASQS